MKSWIWLGQRVCPDEEIEGLTVGDPVEPENAVIPIEQKQ